MISQHDLRKHLSYNCDSGEFFWIYSSCNQVKQGSLAGHAHVTGYIYIQVNGERYRAHRLAWLYMHGKFPENNIDHKNGNPADNRICNLREATFSENSMNTKLRSDNSSGIKGVSWNKAKSKWNARITVRGRRRCLGYFDDIQDAATCYSCASKKTPQGVL